MTISYLEKNTAGHQINESIFNEITTYALSQHKEIAGRVIECEDGQQIFVKLEKGLERTSIGVAVSVEVQQGNTAKKVDHILDPLLEAARGRRFRVIAEVHSHGVVGGAFPSADDVQYLKSWNNVWGH